MSQTDSAVLEFLLNRRSRPAKMLVAPVPDRAQLETLLTAAARVPDHGKLEPWRFIVLEKQALERLADLARARGTAMGLEPDRIEKGVAQYAGADLVVAVIGAPIQSDKIPQIEQTLSAGAVCLSLVNAALAAGWGACWLTGWAAHDRDFAAQGLGLAPQEYVAGMIHIGTSARTPPDRPRPDISRITTWQTD
ncbi:nitroreductase [Rhodobacteraceae bacterium 2376]|uniref:Putative NAD(P)H nitroreductase n=1 Tax=Rhabdonatronobacter sediminivivens TaxID=2743469 RepID=A0A7Z0HX07_9RHOB|nr:nitroreductase [Rhabdonatronobacter sediminivivens]NYS23414.1 nitroreductase [Rhabdonatronobacter sediminivivens]